jgi:hypothetical protein
MLIVYRRFEPKFASAAASLNALLKKGERPKLEPLTEEQLRSFNDLREKLLSPPVLALPDVNIVTSWTPMPLINRSAVAFVRNGQMLQPVGPGAGVEVSRVLSATTRLPRNNVSLSCGRYCDSVPILRIERFLFRTDHHSLR